MLLQGILPILGDDLLPALKGEAFGCKGEYRLVKLWLSRDIITPSSKYYTREVYEELKKLLEKDPDEITWEDVSKMERIHNLLMEEAIESNKPELAEYAGRLFLLIEIAKGLLRKRETTSTQTP